MTVDGGPSTTMCCRPSQALGCPFLSSACVSLVLDQSDVSQHNLSTPTVCCSSRVVPPWAAECRGAHTTPHTWTSPDWMGGGDTRRGRAVNRNTLVGLCACVWVLTYHFRIIGIELISHWSCPLFFRVCIFWALVSNCDPSMCFFKRFFLI